MSEIETGGRAFPWCGDLNEMPSINLGMTLRDYFAAQALSGLVLRAWSDEKGNVPDDVHDRWSKAAYLTADAMLRARSQS
jgi:hypothetical protein